jgi:thiosulfate/3-mercaptopyruvate sulfurtransferase
MSSALKLTSLDEIVAKGYAFPDALVTPAWVAENLTNPSVRIVESNEDQLLYKSGHIPNAVEIDWVRDLNDQTVRDYLDAQQFAALCARAGITKDTTVVFYGDKNNWWACYAFWIFQLFGHTNAKIMDGGRLKWEKEQRELTRAAPSIAPSTYAVTVRDDKILRAFRDDVLKHVEQKLPLVDVRSPDEFSGKKLHMEGYPNEGALRGGHIPGAKSVPWARAIYTEDGTFKSASDLAEIYCKEIGLKKTDDVIAYCRIGERSSHTWFVLRYLLGFSQVRNYDGSWTEWGNLVGVPIEKSL